jgi:hypothetical protein
MINRVALVGILVSVAAISGTADATTRSLGTWPGVAGSGNGTSCFSESYGGVKLLANGCNFQLGLPVDSTGSKTIYFNGAGGGLGGGTDIYVYANSPNGSVYSSASTTLYYSTANATVSVPTNGYMYAQFFADFNGASSAVIQSAYYSP